MPAEYCRVSLATVQGCNAKREEKNRKKERAKECDPERRDSDLSSKQLKAEYDVLDTKLTAAQKWSAEQCDPIREERLQYYSRTFFSLQHRMHR